MVFDVNDIINVVVHVNPFIRCHEVACLTGLNLGVITGVLESLLLSVNVDRKVGVVMSRIRLVGKKTDTKDNGSLSRSQ